MKLNVYKENGEPVLGAGHFGIYQKQKKTSADNVMWALLEHLGLEPYAEASVDYLGGVATNIRFKRVKSNRHGNKKRK